MGILLHMVHAIHYNHTNHLHKYRKSHTHGLFTKIGQIQTICNRMQDPDTGENGVARATTTNLIL